MPLSSWTVFNAVAPVFAIVLAGFAIRRARWLTAEADRSLLRVMVNLLYPALIADATLGNNALRRMDNLAWAPLVGFSTVVLGFGVAWLGARALRLSPGKETRTFSYSVGVYNYGYTAIPVVQALFDKETMGVLFTHNLGVEVAFWLGAILILAAISPRREWHKIFTGPVIAVLVFTLLNLCHAQEWLPTFSLSATHSLGQCAVPLALILTGATLADHIAEMHPRVGWRIAAGACALRLGLLPVLFLALAKWLPCSIELKHVIIVEAAMPAAMLPIVIARHYNGDPKVALQIVLSTSVVSLITIPLWIRLGLAFVG
ncbi:MAG: malate permease [Chthoniobacter sp.]|jgi:predicted permease|nr:malate permease [Chthoniobacter sp.]